MWTVVEDRLEEERWRQVGSALGAARKRRGLTKREAARLAGFSDGQWRDLESGERSLGRGIKVPVNPKDSTLRAAAEAVDLDPAEIFAFAGRDYLPSNQAIGLAAASGATMDELRQLDPEGFETVMASAQLLLDRARQRKKG